MKNVIIDGVEYAPVVFKKDLTFGDLAIGDKFRFTDPGYVQGKMVKIVNVRHAGNGMAILNLVQIDTGVLWNTCSDSKVERIKD